MNIILKYKWLLPHRRRRQKAWKWHRWSLGPCPAAPLYPASCHRSCQCCFKKEKGGKYFYKFNALMHKKMEENVYLFYILTCLCGPSPGPGQRSPCSSEPPCWCASSLKLHAETQWWTACRRSGQAAAPGASSSSRPAGPLMQRNAQTIHLSPFIIIGAELPGLGVHKQPIQIHSNV